jgi:DNA mismatch repair protein MutS
VVEWVHDKCRARCLFATHYHELTRLAERLDGPGAPPCPRARNGRGDLVLLHELAPGPADRSYGIAVARLAGLPPPVLTRAKSILAKLERGRAATGGIAAGLDDLPLFAAAAQEEAVPPDPLRAALDAAAPDALSPREALELVYQLKRIAAGEISSAGRLSVR